MWTNNASLPTCSTIQPGVVEGVDHVAFVAVHRLDAQAHAGCFGPAGQAAIDLHQLAADGRMRRAQVALHGGVGHSAQQLGAHVTGGCQGIGDELLAAAGDGRVRAGDVGVAVQGHAGDAAQLCLRQGSRGCLRTCLGGIEDDRFDQVVADLSRLVDGVADAFVCPVCHPNKGVDAEFAHGLVSPCACHAKAVVVEGPSEPLPPTPSPRKGGGDEGERRGR